VPIFDYKCEDCGEQFEALVLRNSPPAECPACHSRKLEQQISMFAVDSENTREFNMKAARQKGEKIRKEKAHAEHEAYHHDHH
jgi:putative FmdB family regulatory protein